MIGNILSTLANSAVFLLFAGVFWILPGYSLVPKKPKLPRLDRFFLATVIGFSGFAFVLFITRLLKLPFWVGFIPFVLLAWRQRSRIRLRKLTFPKLTLSFKIFIGLAVVGVAIQGLVLFRSAVKTPGGLSFPEISYHDSIWHIYIIGELQEHFPPRHGGSAPALIKNYHFLSDLVIASIDKYLPVSTMEIYFRIYPTFVSILLSLSVFVFTRKLFGSGKANIAVFLTLFSGNASWFVQFFRGDEFRYSANTFMLDPILDLLQNPHAVIIFPMMLASMYGIKITERNSSRKWFIFSALPAGVMIGFKAWGGLLMLGGLAAAAIWSSLVKKRHYYWISFFLSLLLSLVVFLPLYDAKTAAGMIFTPGWLLKRMVEDPDRYNMVKFFLLEQHYREKGNIPRLIQINLTEFLIYLFGNLWIKTAGLLAAGYWLLKKTQVTIIFITSVIVASLLLPVLFNQGRMSYDIIQFGPYSLVLLSIFSSAALVKAASRIPKKIAAFGVALVLLLSIPSNLRSIKDRGFGTSFLVSNARLEAYQFIQEKTDPNSILLLYPSHHNIANAEIAAFTKRPTFFSGRTYSRITGENYEEREKLLFDFFQKVDPQERRKLIEEYSVDYILFPVENVAEFNPAGLNLENIFTNEALTVFQIN